MQPLSWREGFIKVYGLEGTFLSPPLEGWTMVVGHLPAAGDPALLALLENASHQFGEAFYFATLGTVSYYAWARAERGVVRRSFASVEGDLVMNVGERTDEEIELGVGLEDSDFSRDEEIPLALAGEWVFNPNDLDMHTELCGPGWFVPRS
ncbi:MAG: hypothetical protein NTW19_09890 [Planctomycetota bacterium]|nr:hypothetical protein [Planctomycetota bacterium]